MNFFTIKIDHIREKITAKQRVATQAVQTINISSPKEQLSSFYNHFIICSSQSLILKATKPVRSYTILLMRMRIRITLTALEENLKPSWPEDENGQYILNPWIIRISKEKANRNKTHTDLSDAVKFNHSDPLMESVSLCTD